MSFKNKPTTKSGKQYTISIKSANGNTIGFINLSNQFVSKVFGKTQGELTAEDVLSVNGDFQEFIRQATIEVEAVEVTPTVAPSDF